jgi:CheY-like chemotaxis protein
MPRMNGIRCTRELRARGLTTPIVALTANAMADQRAACMAAGCTDFVTKPFEPDALRLLMATLANLRLRTDSDATSALATAVGNVSPTQSSYNNSNSINEDNDRDATLRALRVRQLLAMWAKPARPTGSNITRAPSKGENKAQ